MVKDLVCDMMVDEKSPPAKTTYNGKEYYFCCEACKIQFGRDPDKYIEKERNKGQDEQF
ncbi:MAG: YHS domain-containing protein [Calditrichae bacterium]|nr:YHS domain-containing protein [Calditrichia bacterium]